MLRQGRRKRQHASATSEGTSGRKPTHEAKSTKVSEDSNKCTSSTAGDMPGTSQSVVEHHEEAQHTDKSEMHIAIQAGDFDTVRSLLAEGEKVCWPKATSCISLAVKHDDIKLVEELQAHTEITKCGLRILECCPTQPEMFLYFLEKMANIVKIPKTIVYKFFDSHHKIEWQRKVLNHLKTKGFKFNHETVLNSKWELEIVEFMFENNLVVRKSKCDVATIKKYLRRSHRNPNVFEVLIFHHKYGFLDFLKCSEMIDIYANEIDSFLLKKDRKSVIEFFQYLNLPLEDSKGKSLIHYVKNIEHFLHLLQLGIKINSEHQTELLGKLVPCDDPPSVCQCLDIISQREIDISGGKESLFVLTKSVTVAQKLIDLGCTDEVPPNMLLKLSKSIFALELDEVKCLLDQLVRRGASVTAVTGTRCSLYCQAIRNARNGNVYVCEYILANPAFQDDNFSINCPCKLYYKFPKQLVPLLVANNNFNRIVYSNTDFYYLKNLSILYNFKPYYIGITAAICFYELEARFIVCKSLSAFLEYGLDVKNEPGVSTLCVYLLTRKESDIESAMLCDFKLLQSRGVNIESSVLAFNDEKLSSLQRQLRIPDAFVIAAHREIWVFIEEFYDHLACSPLCTLLFVNSFYFRMPINAFVNKMLRAPTTRVPHGTEVFHSLRAELQRIDRKGQENHTQLFDNIHKQPLTLLELSRYCLRSSLANHAARSHTTSLPELFDSVVPPGLKEHLLRSKIERLRAEQADQ